jgi:hypothetical protein
MQRPFGRRPPARPVAVLTATIAALAALAFLPLPSGFRLVAGAATILAASLNLRRATATGGASSGSPALPWILLPLLVFLALFLRLYRLGSLFGWPYLDEGLFGFIAMRLSHQGWDGRFLYSMTQLPPLTHWSMAAWFRLLEPSLTSLWSFPAAVSIATAAVAYPAFRALLDARTALTAAALWAVSFWPAYAGRIAVQASVFLLLEILALLVLARMARRPAAGRAGWILLLGLVNGVGFCSYLGWPAVALFLVLGLLAHARDQDIPWKRPLALFLAPSLLLPVPMAIQAWRDGYGGYLARIGLFASEGGVLGWILNAAGYVGALLWGVETPLFACKPVWGGLLDPVLGALLLAGIAVLIRTRRGTPERLLSTGLLLGMTPALLTGDFEAVRLTPALPFIMATAALGLSSVTRSLRPSRRLAASLLLLTAVAGAGTYHLLVAYPAETERQSPYHSREAKTAWRILAEMAGREGPGLVFTQMHADPYEQTLAVAVHPFDALGNPRLQGVPVRWAAFVTNANLAPFLARRLPRSDWVDLPSREPRSDGGLALGVAPAGSVDGELLRRWGLFHHRMNGIVYLELNCGVGRPRREVVRSLEAAIRDAGRDPVLTSIAGEALALNLGVDGDTEGMRRAYERAVEEGCPSAHLLNELGVMAVRSGNRTAARAFFRRALSAPVDRTPARENLMRLDAGVR